MCTIYNGQGIANLGITKHIVLEFGKYWIRCNAIAPGTIAT